MVFIRNLIKINNMLVLFNLYFKKLKKEGDCIPECVDWPIKFFKLKQRFKKRFSGTPTAVL